MRAVGEFVKTCVVGGFFGVLPVLLLVLVVVQAVGMVSGIAEPIVAELPVEELGGIGIATLVAIALVLTACFMAGAVLRTRFGAASVELIERAVLNRLPGYSLIKTVSQRFAGVQDGTEFTAALADIHGTGALALVFIVEEHEDGHYTVLAPVAPTPTIGLIYYLKRDRVRPLDATLATAVGCVSQWGIGSGDLLRSSESQAPA